MSDSTPVDDGAVTGDSPASDLLAGATFVALGLGFAIGGSRYEIGSALQMGPGYLPVVLGGVLTVLGLAIVGEGVVKRSRARTADTAVEVATEAPEPVPVLRGGLVVAAIVVFGLTVRGLGLAGALFLATFLAALAGHRNTPLKAAIVAAGLTGLCLVVFVAMLQLNLPVVGDWLGG